MAYRYSVEQKAQALILLAANRGDLHLTASQTGIGVHRLAAWAKRESTLPTPEIGQGMEMAINHLLGEIPNLVNKYNIAELLGTLLEKWLQYKGVPQNSTQTILAVLATKSEKELDRMIHDIDQGRQITMNDQGQLKDVEKELANMGLLGLGESQAIKAESETEVIDLINYQISDNTPTLSNDEGSTNDQFDW